MLGIDCCKWATQTKPLNQLTTANRQDQVQPVNYSKLLQYDAYNLATSHARLYIAKPLLDTRHSKSGCTAKEGLDQFAGHQTRLSLV